MEQVRSEPVVQPKQKTFNQSDLKRKRGRYQLRQTLGNSVRKQELQEQQLRYPFGSSNINQVGIEKQSHQGRRMDTRDVKHHFKRCWVRKPSVISLRHPLLTLRLCHYMPRVTRKGMSKTWAKFKSCQLAIDSPSNFRQLLYNGTDNCPITKVKTFNIRLLYSMASSVPVDTRKTEAPRDAS